MSEKRRGRFDRERALQLLRAGTDRTDASFRPGQEQAIRHLVENLGRLLLIQRTGWGKSFVYFIAAKLLREQGSGPALLISPLLALMRNQIAAANLMGVHALTIHSDNQENWAAVESKIESDEVDILLISPERLANERFRSQVLSEVAARIELLIIDEAHCISDWGHDFRPHYRLIERIARTLPRNLRFLATTATANDRVMDDLEAVLGPNLTVVRGDLHRSSLSLQTLSMPGQAERLAWLAVQLPKIPGSGIIYTLTKRDAAQVAEWLRSKGFSVEAYTSDSGERRVELEHALLENRVKALVATTALGMGFDKPDLAFVIHYQCPGSVVAYYQQVGRAGRAIDTAYGVLMGGVEDAEIIEFFIESAFPTQDEVHQILDALRESTSGLSVPEMLSQINVSKGRIEKALALLSLESPAPLVKEGSKWQLTAAELSAAFWERAKRLTELRRLEREQMQEYLALETGHMAFLVRALDGDVTGISTPPIPPLPSTVSEELTREAVAFLRRTSIPIEPRKQWPAGGMPQYALRGRIDSSLLASEGRALCYWGDAGWGNAVRQGKYHDGHFSNELVDACKKLFNAWNPDPEPSWVTCISSLRHPILVPDFAQRLAVALGLPFDPIMARRKECPEQKTMANSVQQARNLDGVLAVSGQVRRGEAVLLIDDMVDSRWTLTVGAWLLRSNGSGPVFPLVLAQTGAGQ